MNAYVKTFHEEKHKMDPRFLYSALCKAIAKNGSHEDLVVVTHAFENHLEEEEHARTQIA